jgi:mono/diheme cytochrome c family protein
MTRRQRWITGVALVAILGLAGAVLVRRVTGPADDNHLSDEENFKYGSIGNEGAAGVPYWLWLILPRVFPDKLPGPGGYASLGIGWEEGREMPIGFTKTTIGIARVGVNCAACHTTSVRRSPTDKPQFILGGPAQQFDIQAYQRFFIDCAKDPRFTADVLMKELGNVYNFSVVERALYRYVVIPGTRRRLLEQERRFAWMDTRPGWGPGRTDMNPFKLMVLKLKDDGSVGSTDMMAIWNEREHERFLRHSDGLTSSLADASYAAALATGASATSINTESVRRVSEWVLTLPSPRFPFPVNQEVAAHGKSIFDGHCAACHAPGGPRVGTVIPLTEVGTDPSRAKHWTNEAANEFNRRYDAYPWGFDHFRGDMDGYVAPALDGVWARAPYLHNGSVPSLHDLLEPNGNRPGSFYRGNDVYDSRSVGFVSDIPSRGRQFFRFDTELPGNGNEGHLYGTALSPADKGALIEYLKTL